MTREFSQGAEGSVQFAVEAEHAAVQVRVGQVDRAAVRLEPVDPHDQAAAGLVEDAHIERAGDRFTVRLPQQTASVPAPQGVHGTAVGVQSAGPIGTVITGSGVVAHCGSGSMFVNGHRVRATGDGIVISGDAVISDGTASSGKGVRIVAELPKDSAMFLDGVSTSLDVAGELASLKATTVSGDIRAEAARTARVSTTSGSITMDRTEHLRAQSVSGNVRVRELAGQARVSTTSGDIAVHATGTSQLRASSTSGDVALTADEGVQVKDRLSSITGEVTRHTVPAAPRQPETTTTRAETTPGPITTAAGGSMSTVNELRASLTAVDSESTAVTAHLAEARQRVETMLAQLQQAADGSNQPAIQEATGLYRQALDVLSQALGMVPAAQNAITAYLSQL